MARVGSIRKLVEKSSIILVVSLCPLMVESAVQKENKIEVTGSRLKRINIEGPSPISIISRSDIDASGRIAISDILRDISANSFGSAREQSGRSGGQQSHAGINLRGLGQQRTLVLVNGRRIGNSPAIPDAQNLNMIPLAAVERIEILKDGASSIYGSDAVGGVVNIILRRNLQANQIALHLGRPEQEGGDENYLSFWGGDLDNQDSFTYALSVSSRQDTYFRDVPLTAIGMSDYGYPGSYRITVENPNLVGPNPVGPTFLSQTSSDQRCPSALGDSEQFPASREENNLCRFNYAQFANHIPETKMKSLYLAKDHVFSNGDSWFAQLNFSRVDSFGVYAPTPQVGGREFHPTMSADNPNNPTAGGTYSFDSDFDGIADTDIDGPFDIEIFYRNLAGGLRETEVKDDSLNLTAGMEGELKLFGGSHYKFGAQYNRNTTKEVSNGLARRDLLQEALDDGRFDVFAVNGETDLNLAQSFAVPSRYNSEFILSGLDFTINTDLGELDNRVISSAWGVDFKHHQYNSVFDDAFSGNLIDGRAGGGSAEGDRNVVSLFSEINLPLIKALDVNFSARYDSYSDAGSAFSPKLAMTWHINQNWLLRASLGTGFRAPSLFELNSVDNQGFPSVVDTLRCEAAGDSDNDGTPDDEQVVSTLPSNSVCRPNQIQTITGGNTSLEAEDSQSLSAGVVYQPSESTQFVFNFFRQEFSNQITQFPLFELLDIEAENGIHADIIRDDSGKIVQVNRQYNNYSGARAAGFDLAFEYGWQTNDWGEFKYALDLSATLEYAIETIPGQGYIEVDDSIGRPNHRFTMGLDWNLKAWSANLDMLVIPSMEQQQTELGSWTPMALQVNYKTKFGLTWVFGVRNLFDLAPPSSQSLGHPYYLVGLSEITGRTPYIRFIQNF